MRLRLTGVLEPRLELLLDVIECRDAAFIRGFQSLLECVGGKQPFAAIRILSRKEAFDPHQPFSGQREHGFYTTITSGEVVVIDARRGVEPTPMRQFAGGSCDAEEI